MMIRVCPPITTCPATAGAPASAAARFRLVGRHQHQANAALRRRRKLFRLETLAVDDRHGLDGGAGRQAAELGPAGIVGLDRAHLGARRAARPENP